LPTIWMNWSAWLSRIFWQTPHRAHMGALPESGQVSSELIPQEAFNSNNLPDRLLARDMQSYQPIVHGERLVETGLPVIFSRLFP
jgi:hypothetical protein